MRANALSSLLIEGCSFVWVNFLCLLSNGGRAILQVLLLYSAMGAGGEQMALSWRPVILELGIGSGISCMRQGEKRESRKANDGGILMGEVRLVGVG
ncbi:unnamed protein product [Linum trigynum]|uniref:Uncharacterized protein n=1 Tax=Linum trigynum TaxID=586398 RepID=A0AAV2DEJ3_9ROSI